MSTSRKCTSCGAALEAADRFCPSCGRPVDRTGPAPESPSPVSSKVTCPCCGQENAPASPTCSACGALIGTAGSSAPPPRAVGGRDHPLRGFQSWKFTLGAAALLVAGLIIYLSLRHEPEPAHSDADPHEAGMMERIRELQARTDQHPDDAGALLEFANLLYDVRFFERAAGMYDRYLRIHPENADARVDMGTSYFQMAFSGDSTAGVDLTARAESCFVEAIRTKPDHQLAHFNLGILHLHRGDVDGANEWFRKCVAIDPGTEAAKRAQQLLSQHIQNNPS